MTTGTDSHLLECFRRIEARPDGAAILADRRRLAGLLLDLAPEARREVRLIGLGLADGVPAELLAAPPGQLPLEIERLADRLENLHAIRPDLARWAVVFWAKALRLAIPAESRALTLPEGEGPATWDDGGVPARPAAPRRPPGGTPLRGPRRIALVLAALLIGLTLLGLLLGSG